MHATSKRRKTGFLAVLDRFADYRDITRPAITQATVDVTERHARRVLKIKKPAPLVYRGMELRCIGSQRKRNMDGARI